MWRSLEGRRLVKAQRLLEEIRYIDTTIYAIDCHAIVLHKIRGIWFLHDLLQNNLCKRFQIIITDSLFSEWCEIKLEALQDTVH